MQSFVYDYPVKNYFGEGAVDQALAAEPPNMGSKAMLAYGGGLVKRTGVYDKVRLWATRYWWRTTPRRAHASRG